jgi:hypothetical protein
VREGGRTVNVHALITVGVTADGEREVLGLEVASEEDGAGWLGFLRSLTARGLAGVKLVFSNAHRGVVDAIGAALPGAAWHRCRTHYLRNLLAKVPRSAQPWVATMVRTIFDQPDVGAVRDQYARVVEAVAARFPDAATHLDDARDDLLAFASFPARDLAADLVQPPARTAHQGDPPPHRRGRHLPQPGRHHPPRRRGTGRADRCMDRTTPLHGSNYSQSSADHHQRRRDIHRRTPPQRRSPCNINPDLHGDRLQHHAHGRGPDGLRRLGCVAIGKSPAPRLEAL